MHIDPMTVIVGATAVASVVLLIVWSKGGSAAADAMKTDQYLQTAHLEKQKGNWAIAESYLERALQVFEMDPVPKDFTKHSSCIVHLADCYAHQAKHKEMREMYQKLHSFWRDQIERGDDSTLMDIDYFVATADFGSATQDIADLYKDVLDIKTRRFPPGHTEITNGMLLYSKLLAKLGDREQAERLETEARAIQQRSQPS